MRTRIIRLLILWVAVLFIGGFALLTIGAVVEQGLTVGSLLSAFIVILLAVGIIGALINPPG